MPRITPADDIADERLQQLNIFKTVGRHPKMLDGITRLGGFLLSGVGLPARERELVILRTGWRCGSIYEWGQHVVIARREGITDEEIARLRTPGLDGWSDADAALVAMADELCQTNTVSAATWDALASRFTDEQLIELLVLGGFYRMIAGILNATDVEREPGVPGWEAGASAQNGTSPE
jgi:alkylhydroperoxidase family enzyme